MKTLIPIHFVLMLLAFLLFPNFVSAQDTGRLVTFKKGKIFTSNGNLIDFQMLRQTDDYFFYQNINGEIIGILKEEVNLIKKQSGSYALVYGASSGVSAAVGFLIGSAVSQRVVSDKTKRNGLIVSILSGTLFGLIYGSTKKKYATVYESPNLKRDLGQLKIDITSPNEIPSFTLSYAF